MHSMSERFYWSRKVWSPLFMSSMLSISMSTMWHGLMSPCQSHTHTHTTLCELIFHTTT